MKITMQNCNNKEYELLLDNLIQEVFDFSFVPWFQLELWDERYESYSLIDHGEMLANVCIFKTDLIVAGKKLRVHQFGAIATRKAYRRKGFARLLIEHVINKYPDVPAFLFANSSVLNFYPRFGFKRIYEHQQNILLSSNNMITEKITINQAVKLKIDAPMLHEFIENRNCFSLLLDCENTQPIQWFHLLLEYSENIYFLPKCNLIMIAKQKNEKLFVADLIAKNSIDFDLLVQNIPFDGIKELEFGFCIDALDTKNNWHELDNDDNPLFIYGNLKLPKNFRFPVMSIT